MIISCVKWGDKYNHEHVNRLYRMCQKTIDDDFTFVCYTENSEGINSDIHITPLGDYDLEKWWWKLCLFEKPTDKVNFFFDLDVVLQSNITHLKTLVNNKITLIKAFWKPEFDSSIYDHNINSSVMIWTGDQTHVWNQFIDNPEYYMMKYNGIDGYLYYEHNDGIGFIPRGVVYSRMFGVDELLNSGPDLYTMDYPICIFNGWRRETDMSDGKYLLDNDGYNGFEHYWD